MVKPIMLGKIVNDGTKCAGASCLRFPPLSLLLQQVQVNKRTFLERTWHGFPLKLFATATYDEFISTLVAGVFLPLV